MNFMNKTQSQPSSGLFGSSTGSMFGGGTSSWGTPQTNPTPNTSIFGGIPSTGGIFGTQPGSGGGFSGTLGASPNFQTQSPGGFNSFGTIPSGSGGLMGSQGMSNGLNPSTAGGIFGAQQASGFMQPSTPGFTPPTQTSGGLFASTNAPSGGGFGSFNSSSGSGLFGTPTSSVNTFGNQTQSQSFGLQSGAPSWNSTSLQQQTPFFRKTFVSQKPKNSNHPHNSVIQSISNNDLFQFSKQQLRAYQYNFRKNPNYLNVLTTHLGSLPSATTSSTATFASPSTSTFSSGSGSLFGGAGTPLGSNNTGTSWSQQKTPTFGMQQPNSSSFFQANAGGGLFQSAPSTTNTTTTSLFGGSNPSMGMGLGTGQPQMGVFNQSTNNPPSSSGGLFSQQTSTNPSSGGLFSGSSTGTGLFSTSTPTSGGLFSTVNPSQTQGNSLFQAGSSSLFGQGATTPNNGSGAGSGGLFSSQPTTNTGAGLFGSGSGGGLFNTATSSGLFSTTPTSGLSSGGLFGTQQTSSLAGGSLFGGQTSQLGVGLSTGTSLYGGSQGNPGLFSSTTTNNQIQQPPSSNSFFSNMGYQSKLMNMFYGSQITPNSLNGMESAEMKNLMKYMRMMDEMQRRKKKSQMILNSQSLKNQYSKKKKFQIVRNDIKAIAKTVSRKSNLMGLGQPKPSTSTLKQVSQYYNKEKDFQVVNNSNFLKGLYQYSKPSQDIQKPDQQQLSMIQLIPKIGNDLKMNPSQRELMTYSRKQLTSVQSFTVWNDFGRVKFLRPVNVLGLQIDKIISIKQSSIQIYKSKPPAPGEQLNQPCELTFFNIANIKQKYQKMSQKQLFSFYQKLQQFMRSNKMKKVKMIDPVKNQWDLVVTLQEV